MRESWFYSAKLIILEFIIELNDLYFRLEEAEKAGVQEMISNEPILRILPHLIIEFLDLSLVISF